MRISGGTLKGLIIPRTSKHVRPTMEKMRLSLFSILGNITNLHFLDLFSGSGIVGLEAYSRGAVATLVERDKTTAQRIQKSIHTHHISLRIYSMPVEVFLRKKQALFDIIYCDPPFAYRYKADLLRKIACSSLITSKTLIILHHPKNEHLLLKGLLETKDIRHYGQSSLHFFTLPVEKVI